MRTHAYVQGSVNGARFLRLLADETRLRILSLLSRTSDLCVCEFVAVLRLPQYRISRHLGQLRRNGLLTSRREGPFVFYGLAESVRRHPVQGAVLRAAPRLAARELVALDLKRMRRLMKLENGQGVEADAADGTRRLVRAQPALRLLGRS